MLSDSLPSSVHQHHVTLAWEMYPLCDDSVSEAYYVCWVETEADEDEQCSAVRVARGAIGRARMPPRVLL